MPLLNLSLVTQTFTTLIQRVVSNSSDWDPLNVLNVSPLPPDGLTGDFTIGWYLYHVMEDPAYKNLPPLVDADNPDVFQPMGLQLYYVMTAHSDQVVDASALTEQLMMGLAMKALRDHPCISEDTVVLGLPVFPAALVGRQNRFRVTLQPPEARESMAYWMAGSQPMRLAAYYQVAPVLLEPEPLSARAGRVILYGVHTFLRGRPRLDGSQSTVTFTLPGEASPRSVQARPAEATAGQALVFLGTDLAGDETGLQIQHVDWAEPVEVDPLQWGITGSSERLFATVQAFAGAQPVLPGIYLAAARVVTRRTMPDGTIREFLAISNTTAFAVTPRIDSIAVAAGLHTVTGTNFDPALLPEDRIQLYAGPERLERVGAAPGAGQFRVVDADTIEFRFPAGFTAGEIVAFRILIRGAESSPAWLTVP